MVKFGPPLPAKGRLDFFFVTWIVAFFVLFSVRMPFATVAAACLSFQILLLLSVGH